MYHYFYCGPGIGKLLVEPKSYGGSYWVTPSCNYRLGFFLWGTAFGGVLGMIMGIPMTAFLITIWRLMLQKYL